MARGNLLKLSTPDNVLSSIACFISASSFSAFGVRCPTAEHTSPLTLGCPFQSSDDSLVCPLDLRIPPMHLSAWNWSSGSAVPRDGPASRSSCSLRSNQVQPPSMQSKTFFYEWFGASLLSVMKFLFAIMIHGWKILVYYYGLAVPFNLRMSFSLAWMPWNYRSSMSLGSNNDYDQKTPDFSRNWKVLTRTMAKILSDLPPRIVGELWEGESSVRLLRERGWFLCYGRAGSTSVFHHLSPRFQPFSEHW